MKKRGYEITRSLLSIVMITIVLVSSLFSAHVMAQDTEVDQAYFVVEKEWVNDIPAQRPNNVVIHVVGSDGKEAATGVLTAANDWKATFKLDTKTNTGELITYSVYEEESGLDAYQLGAVKDSPVTITKSATVKRNQHSGGKYVLNDSGVNNAPEGSVVIDSELLMQDALLNMSDNFVYMPECRVYGNRIDIVNTSPRIAYTGNLIAGANSVGSVSMFWKDKATNSYTGEKYDVRVTLNNIVIYSLVNIDNSGGMDRYAAILANQGNLLHMQAYVGPNFDTANIKKDIIGVDADVKIEVLENDNPVSETTTVYLQDIDMPDYAKFYEDGNVAGTPGQAYYGVSNAHTESVDLTSGVLSDIYVESEDVNLFDIKITDSMAEFAAKRAKTGAEESLENLYSLKYLANAGSYSLHWSGSNCGTVIVSKGASPVISDVTNKITNVSSRYKIEYYYQIEEGEKAYYAEIPDYSTSETAVKPGTEVAVSESDKKPNPEKDARYVLDEAMNKEWKGTTTADPAKNPLVLKVYFKKQYVVRYHDNVADEDIFDMQNNPNLDYYVDTPAFKTDEPKRQGYDFLGWTTYEGKPVKDEDIMKNAEVQAIKVTDDADYWAQWKPAINKYKVEYYYEVDGKYPVNPDFTSPDRVAYTLDEVSIIDSDKVPQKEYYVLNDQMTVEWTGIVAADGSLILKVYFRPVPRPVTKAYAAPVTGVE